MTLDLPPRPALPPCPEPEGYGFGQPLLDVLRLREHLLADWRVRVAHAEACNALAREADMAEALAARNRRIANCQPDPPTAPIPGLPYRPQAPVDSPDGADETPDDEAEVEPERPKRSRRQLVAAGKELDPQVTRRATETVEQFQKRVEAGEAAARSRV